jgi:Putative Ig domain
MALTLCVRSSRISERNCRGGRNGLSGIAFALLASLLAGCGASTTVRTDQPPSTLTVTTTTLSAGQVGVAYSATLAATGGTAPYAWTLTSGALPAGLTLSASGAITGTPTAPVTSAALTFTVTDSGSPQQSKPANLTLTITAAGVAPPAVTTTSLPNGQVGVAYSATLSATGGTTPYTWTLTSGTLPAGLTLSSSGTITGTPTVAVSATPLTFTVRDAGTPQQSATVNLTLTIAGASVPVLAIGTTALPNGQVGTAYSATLSATGGTAPYAWSLTSGALPAGLTLSASGVITGTPTASVTSLALTFTVTDSGSPQQSKQANLTLTITAAGVAPLAGTTTSLPNGQVGAAYTAALAATGGTTPYTWTLTSGTLPAGLTLASTGAISGTPTAAVNATPLTFTVRDTGTPQQSAQVNVTLTIAPATLAVTTTSLPNGTVGTAYSATLAATGGTTPYTWTLTSGTLPAGLTLSASGAISGTPTAAVTSAALTFTVTDAGAPAQSVPVNLTLTIAAPSLTVTTSTLPSGVVGTAYTASLAASGGTAPYTWTLTTGSLPAGLTLASTGGISGTPTATFASTLTFTVKDSSTPAQSKPVTLGLTIAGVLTISTTSLPNGTVGTAYTSTLAASGGTTPYTWTLTSGTLPAGLTLASTGVISGTPTATATATALTFTATDASVPAQSKTVNLTLTVTSSGVTVSISPKRAAIAAGQTLALTPTVSDSAGVNWSASGTYCSGTTCGIACSGNACGTFSPTKTLSGVAVTYTAPATGGTYTITATSVTDSTVSTTAAVAVTDLPGVATFHNNLSRTGTNTQEYALTPSTVTASNFGKLYSCTVDGAIYGQPLWVPNVTVSGVKHNVVYVATQHDSIYAFDADAGTSPCTPLWKASLLDTAHGAGAGELAVASAPPGPYYVGSGYGDISPEVGVLGTPVIDLTTGTLYAVSKSMITSGPTFYQRLHALDLTSGTEKFSGPGLITGTYPGTGDGGTTTTFNPKTENQRPGLALANGAIYIAWASHEDTMPYYGWVIAYSASNVTQQVAAYNDAPNTGWSGIWMSGGAPAGDAAGSIYFLTGNGTFNATNGTGAHNDFGDSFLKLSSSLAVQSYFTPSDQLTDQTTDGDFGAGGATVLVDLAANGTNPTHLVLGGGKDHTMYVLNRDALGGSGDSNAWQVLTMPGGIFSTGAFWNSTFYIATAHGQMQAYTLDPSTAKFTLAPNAGATTFGWPGMSPSVSSMPDNSNGVVWGLETHLYCTTQAQGCSPAILHAFDAGNLSSELWNSSQGTGNAAGYAVKFTVPTVANGRVYVGTRGNNTGGAESSTSTPGELDVYGILPN